MWCFCVAIMQNQFSNGIVANVKILIFPLAIHHPKKVIGVKDDNTTIMLWKAETPINTVALPILFPYCSAIFPTAYKIWDLGINAGKKMLPSFVLLVILSNCFYVLLFVVSSFPALSPQPKQKWTKMNQSFLIGVWWKKTIFAIRKNPAHNVRSLKHFSLWYFVSKIGRISEIQTKTSYFIWYFTRFALSLYLTSDYVRWQTLRRAIGLHRSENLQNSM